MPPSSSDSSAALSASRREGLIARARARLNPERLVGGHGSLRRRASLGAGWVLSGHATSQVLRLGSNLVLTRLLFPEAFGLMALVQVFLAGLQMFSDVGIRASIVQNKRGEDQRFVNTAWTIQVFRGLVLWLVCIAAARPFASFYGEPQLASLVPVAGLTALLSGFNSTKLATADRKLRFARVTLIEIGAQITAIVVMVSWAVIWPSVWALVAGGIVRVAAMLIASHALIPGEKNRFCWDRNSTRDIIKFGRWIFLTTVVAYLLQQGDKLVIAKLISAEMLGVYAIAVLWSRLAVELGLKVGSRVAFPALAEVANNRRERLRQAYKRARIIYFTSLLPITWTMAVFGDVLVNMLYDERYSDAGWMIRLLAPGFAGAVISGLRGSVLKGVGDSFSPMVAQVCRGVLLAIGIAVGWHLGELPGLLIGMSASKILDYPVVAWALHRHQLWLPSLDLSAFGVTAIVVAAGWIIFPPGVIP